VIAYPNFFSLVLYTELIDIFMRKCFFFF